MSTSFWIMNSTLRNCVRVRSHLRNLGETKRAIWQLHGREAANTCAHCYRSESGTNGRVATHDHRHAGAGRPGASHAHAHARLMGPKCHQGSHIPRCGSDASSPCWAPSEGGRHGANDAGGGTLRCPAAVCQ